MAQPTHKYSLSNALGAVVGLFITIAIVGFSWGVGEAIAYKLMF